MPKMAPAIAQRSLIDDQRIQRHAALFTDQKWIHIHFCNGALRIDHEMRESDKRLRQRIFSAIEAEWQRTAEALALITGEKTRLQGNPALARSIRHRFPYIDPLHHLQVELIRRYRAGISDERAQRGIHLSINGIAAGLRNTG